MLRGISMANTDNREGELKDLTNRIKALMNHVSVEEWVKAIRSSREER
jgi:hypothetical protein